LRPAAVPHVEPAAAAPAGGGPGRRLRGHDRDARLRLQRRFGVGDPLPRSGHPRFPGCALTMPAAGLPYAWHAFHLPKHGHRAEEYEDAHAADGEVGRFAVADGASESSYAGLWAQLLAGGFVQDVRRPWGRADWLEPLQRRWSDEVDGVDLPWYAEVKREQGA